ncbi:hypothetical protein [Flavobacterium sp. ASW18X]|uniref:hypothetical protein n=1 Tax=Flavobacterium sp. ASW18X TaxID=2572595 RepID=UPI0010ADE84F|nr:hypothetical protein [Flavobacterium sp. ASW18X]TKD60924.1 hypothetical protein FBT53_11720 [Flavobacterium sp. ASW18X]
MFKNPVVKDGIKALAIFLLPFLSYIHMYAPDDLDYELWRYYKTQIYNTFFSGLVYVELNYFYLTCLFLIWFNNIKDKHLYGVYFIITSLIANSFNYVFPIFDGYLELTYLIFHLCSLTYLLFKKDYHYRIRNNNQLNPLNLLLVVVGLLYICCHLNLFSYTSKELNLGFVTISSYGFQNFNTFNLVAFIKIYGIIAFLIWFFTEKKWWRYAILSPILLLVNQFYNCIISNGEDDIIDEFELYQSGPFLLTLLIALLLLAQAADHQERIKAFLLLQYQHIEHAVEQRFGKQQQNIEEKKQRLATKKDLSKAELAALKKELEQELKKLS